MKNNSVPFNFGSHVLLRACCDRPLIGARFSGPMHKQDATREDFASGEGATRGVAPLSRL